MAGDPLVYMAEGLEEVVRLGSKAGHQGFVVAAYLVWLVVLILQGPV